MPEGTWPSKTIKIETGHGNLYITIIEGNGSPCKIICTIGQNGDSIRAKAVSVGSLASLALKHGATLDEIIEKLQDIRGSKPMPSKRGTVWSIPDAVAKALNAYLEWVKERDNGLKHINW